ncbi:MAG: ABC transporter permease, partial [Bacteroidota bacterium]
NLLAVALRAFAKERVTSLLNVGGLALGLACVFLILLFVRHEQSYDRFHDQAEQIYRVTEFYEEDGEMQERSASVPWPVGPTMQADIPGVTAVRFYQTWQKTPLLAYEPEGPGQPARRFYEEQLFFTDPAVFEVFDGFELVQGDPALALAEPQTIVLTETTARKYFDEADPIGRTLVFEDTLAFTVTGILADPPANTHVEIGALASIENTGAIFAATGNELGFEGWYWNPVHTYVRLDAGVSAAEVEREVLPGFVAQYFPEVIVDGLTLSLQPLTTIRLREDPRYQELYQEIGPVGSAETVRLFSWIAVFVLLLAVVNYTNLATARSMLRAKEVGVRRTLGAGRRALVGQFLAEALVASVAAGALGLVLATVARPGFERIVGAPVPQAGLLDPTFLAFAAVLVVGTGLLAGLYPAFVLSGFRPADVLMGKGSRGAGGAAWLRRGLVVGQFAVTIALLAGAAVVVQQLRFLQTKDLGFEQEQIVMIPIRGTTVKDDWSRFKDALTEVPGVVSASAVSDVIGADAPIRNFGTRDDSNDDGAIVQVPGLFVDADFAETFDVTIVEGRDLGTREEGFADEDRPDRDALLINETLAADLGMAGTLDDGRMIGGNVVVGVMADFQMEGLRRAQRPLVVMVSPWWYAFAAVRLAPGDARATLASIETLWQRYEPVRPMSYTFLDDNLDALYQTEARLATAVGAFAALALVVACLGLFGLATFTIQRRTKEIGVRKVLGASVPGLVRLLARDFVVLVAVAFVVAAPAAWFALHAWLDGFAYRVDLSATPLLAAGVLALAIALGTVGVQAWRAATSDPVHALRTE